MNLPKWVGKKDSPKYKSKKQEKKSARDLLGETTIASGALPFDKADIRIRRFKKSQFEPVSFKIECKRTDAKSIILKKSWIDKLKRECTANEFWAIDLQIQDEDVMLISKNDFKFLSWILTTPTEKVLEVLASGEKSE